MGAFETQKPYPPISTKEFFTGKSHNGFDAATKIVMANGSIKAIGDVEIGDDILGDHGVTKVVRKQIRETEAFIIEPCKGEPFIAALDQVLHFKVSRNEFGRKNGDDVRISVKEYLEQSKKKQRNLKLFHGRYLTKEKALPIEPYFLGVWLGDGDSDSIYITTKDPEIIEYLEEYGRRLGMTVQMAKYGDKCPRYRIGEGYKGNQNFSIQRVLREELNVLRNKHIPAQYLINSEKIQLETLAGIIDADGHKYKNGKCYEVVQVSEVLAQQIKLLASLLGFRTTIRKKTTSIKPNKNYPKGFEGEAFRIIISGDVYRIPTKISRKKITNYSGNKNCQVSGIGVEPLSATHPVIALELDSSDCFFLADMTQVYDLIF